EVKKFVHPWKGNNASGHLTGGAIDLTLYDVRNKRLMPMESSKLTFVENSMTKQTELPNYIKRNRELLQRVMKEVGFVNYPREYWHWSYGDVRWARIMGKKRAIYGVIN
ncbi:hypothetical protein KJ855_01200, partial [Patescibacteria group bacterium]|nr:hypothetical protein [Patescibacteria group bacterium]